MHPLELSRLVFEPEGNSKFTLDLDSIDNLEVLQAQIQEPSSEPTEPAEPIENAKPEEVEEESFDFLPTMAALEPSFSSPEPTQELFPGEDVQPTQNLPADQNLSDQNTSPDNANSGPDLSPLAKRPRLEMPTGETGVPRSPSDPREVCVVRPPTSRSTRSCQQPLLMISLSTFSPTSDFSFHSIFSTFSLHLYFLTIVSKVHLK